MVFEVVLPFGFPLALGKLRLMGHEHIGLLIMFCGEPGKKKEI